MEQEGRHIVETRAHTWAPSQRSAADAQRAPESPLSAPRCGSLAARRERWTYVRRVVFAMAGAGDLLAPKGSPFNRRSDGVIGSNVRGDGLVQGWQVLFPERVRRRVRCGVVDDGGGPGSVVGVEAMDENASQQPNEINEVTWLRDEAVQSRLSRHLLLRMGQ